jgi:HAD superfamily hydrolase (TIGR01484 family)
MGLLQSPVHGEYIWFGPAEDDNEYQRDYASDPTRSDLIRRCAMTDLAKVQDVLTMVHVGVAESIKALTEALSSRLECNIYPYRLQQGRLSGLQGFDLLPVTNTKAQALQWLTQHFGFSLQEVMAVGDGPNDVEMFEVAGLGVAMGNAIAEVKARAGATVASNNEDGVAEAIERFILSA